jgi:Ni/Co efflux regulator RcnB
MKKAVIAQLVIVSLLGTSGAAFAQQHNDDHHGVPHNDWHKGERLPAEYRDHNYVVDDWHEHGLHAPPRGYQWVGVNGDYVLAAVATGVIASVLLSGH